MRWKKRAAAALALVMVMSGLTGPHPAGGAGPTGDRQWDGKTHSVTLITGDRVMVTSLANGTHRVTYAPGPGREHVGFLKRAGKDRIDIIPSDALRPLSAGKLDPRLFEVFGLIRHGYDDRSGADIPLIAQGGSRAAVSGATVVRALPSINAVAIHESKRSAATFYSSRWVFRPAPRRARSAKSRSSIRATTARPGGRR